MKTYSMDLRDRVVEAYDRRTGNQKEVEVVAVIEATGAKVWFLPPYSPDLNPIEKMWSKVKAHLRKVKARTQEALWQAIGEALNLVTSEDAVAWFRSCGYIRA